jgi:hypothetical protein
MGSGNAPQGERAAKTVSRIVQSLVRRRKGRRFFFSGLTSHSAVTILKE